jgi:hypothetical protein
MSDAVLFARQCGSGSGEEFSSPAILYRHMSFSDMTGADVTIEETDHLVD